MNKNWVRIYSTTYLHKAEIAKAILEEERIEAVVKNMQDSFYKFGEIELYVKSEDVFKANQIIEKASL